MATITKRDLARKVAENSGCSSNFASHVVNMAFEAMKELLTEGERIEIRGFGVLNTKETKPKPKARNPRTGEVISVPARRKTHFKTGKEIKVALCSPAEPPSSSVC